MKRATLVLFLLTGSVLAYSQWGWQNPLPQGNRLNSLYFTDSITGYAVGDGGTILKTFNGGSGWFPLPGRTSCNLNSVCFTGSGRGYAAGGGGTILKTIDGGTGWIALSSATHNGLFSVCFTDAANGYGTLFHELVHSTGHMERLNRRELTESKGMTTNDYAIEELTAEMGASYLKSHAGIPIEQLENNASYIKYWLERLKNDKRYIVHASAQAQKATDFILRIYNEEKEIDPLEEPTKTTINRVEEIESLRCNNQGHLYKIERKVLVKNIGCHFYQIC